MEALLPQHTDRLYDLASTMLQEGVRDRLHPFHFMSLATIGLDGVPKSRTVVLRRFDPFHRVLCFHSDIRSPKIQEMKRSPFISLLFYSQRDKLQVRITGRVHIHHKDDTTISRWEQTQTMSKLTYLCEYAPSSLFLNEELPVQKPTAISGEEDRRAFENFGVIVCDFYEMDITELHDASNLRVRISWDRQNRMHSERLIP